MRPPKALWGVLFVSIGSAAFACDNPPLAKVPKPEGLSPADQQRVREDVQAYFDAMRAYTACLQAELVAAGGDSAPGVLKASMVLRNNAAVAEAEVVLKLFNDYYGAAAAGPPEPAPAAPAGQGSSRRRDRDN
jgi:hypothetical protein